MKTGVQDRSRWSNYECYGTVASVEYDFEDRVGKPTDQHGPEETG